jgi:sugar phosphate isomerase/epimerase
VILALENTARPDYVNTILSRIASANLALCYDSSHDFLHGNPPGSILDKWGHRLVTTHFADNDGERDDHWLPGEGTADWACVRRSFPSRTYDGAILLEALPKLPEDSSPQVFLETAYERAKRLKNELSLKNNP